MKGQRRATSIYPIRHSAANRPRSTAQWKAIHPIVPYGPVGLTDDQALVLAALDLDLDFA